MSGGPHMPRVRCRQPGLPHLQRSGDRVRGERRMLLEYVHHGSMQLKSRGHRIRREWPPGLLEPGLWA